MGNGLAGKSLSGADQLLDSQPCSRLHPSRILAAGEPNHRRHFVAGPIMTHHAGILACIQAEPELVQPGHREGSEPKNIIDEPGTQRGGMPDTS